MSQITTLSSEATTTAFPPDCDPRDGFIARTVPGRSFCDVGGLWGVTSEKVSVAHAAGAARVAMIDATHPRAKLWRSLHERLESIGVRGLECISADINSAVIDERFDVVHCSGVVYHSPSPITTLDALRRITSGHLILTSFVVPAEIRNAAGTISFSDGQMLFLPYLDKEALAVIRTYMSEVGVTAAGIDIVVPRWPLDDYAPWWWLFTASAVRQMVAVAGFEVVEEASTWDGKARVFLTRAAGEGRLRRLPTRLRRPSIFGLFPDRRGTTATPAN